MALSRGNDNPGEAGTQRGKKICVTKIFSDYADGQHVPLLLYNIILLCVTSNICNQIHSRSTVHVLVCVSFMDTFQDSCINVGI